MSSGIAVEAAAAKGDGRPIGIEMVADRVSEGAS
jgi:hypothetical protein